MSTHVGEEQQRVYFTRQEIQAWSGVSGLKYLVAQWLSEGGFQEAFTALVSTLTRGKDLSSPTKRRKRAANQAYFAQLSGVFTKSAASSSKNAVGAFSTSPINTMSSSSGSGSGSSSSKKQQKSPMSTMSSSTSLSSTSPTSLSPRTSSANESRTTYVLDLVKGLTNQSERWSKIPVDEVLSIVLLMDANDSYLVSWHDFFAFSTRIDEGLREDINTPAQQVRVLYDLLVQEKVARAEEGFRLPLVANDATTTRLRALAMHARDALRLNPLMMLFQLMNANNHDSLSELDAMIDSEALVMLFQHLGAHIGDESGVMKARIELSTKLNHAESVFEASTAASPPASSKKQAKGKTSSPSGKGSASSSSSSSSNSSSSSSMPKGGVDPELDQDLFKLRENAAAIAAKLASQSQNMEQTLSIWSALQALEKELVKASSTGSFVGISGGETNVDGNNKSSSSSSRSSVESSSRQGSPSRRNLSLDTSYELDETEEDVEVAQVKSAKKQTLRTPSTNDRNVSSSSSMLSSGGSISISSSSGKKKKPHQRLSSSSASSSASKRVNMTIFKSPSTHVHGNVNAYNNETYMWQPTLLTGKYNERFQTTHENMEAKKVFGRFFGGEGL